MGRFMIVVTVAIISGAIIGVVTNQNGLTEDQSLSICVLASLIILYSTRNLNETD